MSMADNHCPGFESNKKLNAVNVKCPECGKTFEVFSDEMDKTAKCAACGSTVNPKECKVD